MTPHRPGGTAMEIAYICFQIHTSDVDSFLKSEVLEMSSFKSSVPDFCPTTILPPHHHSTFLFPRLMRGGCDSGGAIGRVFPVLYIS